MTVKANGMTSSPTTEKLNEGTIKWGMPIAKWRGCAETFGKNITQSIAEIIAPNIGGNFFEKRKKKERARKTNNGIPLSKGFFTTE